MCVCVQSAGVSVGSGLGICAHVALGTHKCVCAHKCIFVHGSGSRCLCTCTLYECLCVDKYRCAHRLGPLYRACVTLDAHACMCAWFQHVKYVRMGLGQGMDVCVSPGAHAWVWPCVQVCLPVVLDLGVCARGSLGAHTWHLCMHVWL